MRDRILQELSKSASTYISGQAISNKLDISRAAVWKHISALRALGYDIESKSRCGYKLKHSPDVISVSCIQNGLRTEKIGHEMIYKTQMDSTNTEAKKVAVQGAVHGLVVLCETQTSGRGRMDRPWISPSGGIFVSIVLRPNLKPQKASILTFVAALAIVRTLSQIGIESKIKWPNDVVAGSKKIAGILTEMASDFDGIQWVVVGMGINVNFILSEKDGLFNQHATSVEMQLGKKIDRNKFLQQLLFEFEALYHSLLNENILEILHEYRKKSATLGQQVRIENAQNTVEALALDVDETGALLIQYIDKRIEKIIAGEVSVRGLMGYI